MPKTKLSAKKQRIIGLDSLRCLAIILIVVYHCFPGLLPAGFIAVEIFFALSGFLIAQKFLREASAGEPFNIKGFFKFFFARLKKFFPALLFCIIITLSLAYFTDPDLLTAARPNTLYAATFSTNIAAIVNGSSYESALIPNLFNHTWFLALELQVCLIAYFVFALFFSLAGHNRRKLPKLGITCVLIGLVSFALMAIYGGRFELFDRAYFGPDSHIGAFFLGSALAVFAAAKSNFAKPARLRAPYTILLIASLLAMVAITPFVSYASAPTFFVALPAAAIFSCIAIFAVLKLQSDSTSKFLRPFEFIGALSFYIYLLHWPLYILFADLFDFLPLDLAAALSIVASFLLSLLCQKVIFPFFARRRVINYFIILVALILPTLSLIKAPEKSSIEQNLESETTEDFSAADFTADFQADYTGAVALSRTLQNEVLPYFSQAEKFAIAYVPTNAAANISTNTSGRAAYNTPDLSRLSALKKSNVMVLGDSVVLGAQSSIESTIGASFVDAKGSRNMFDAINLLAGYRAANNGKLPRIIVLGLVTNNSNFNASTLQAIVKTAGSGHAFVFVTGYCGQRSRATQNNIIKNFAAANANVYIADWQAIVSKKPATYTYSDHTHLNPTGRSAYAKLIKDTIKGL